MKRMLGVVLFAATLTATSAAQAGSYFGTLWLVQNPSAPATLRFVTISGPSGVSLFATGDLKEVMLQAFFKKAKINVGYAPLTPCPDSLSGPCGTVNFISASSSGF